MAPLHRATLAKRADFFQALAEALYEPPAWLALSGSEWPLTAAVEQLAAVGSSAQELAAALSRIPAEPLPTRQERYAALFAGPGRPRFWLYESMYGQGRLLSWETAEVERYYRAAGLQVSGAEMADHASLELAFIDHLCRRQVEDPAQARQWHALERRFIEGHAGRWLPDLGRALTRTGDLVYGPLGGLLNAAFSRSAFRASRPAPATQREIPFLHNPATCTLCGFCVQACPTGALAVRETSEETRLILSIPACISCGKCDPICPTKTLQLGPPGDRPGSAPLLLRHSARLSCPGCGLATVSQAEMDFVTAQIGPAPWLAFCPGCRSVQMDAVR